MGFPLKRILNAINVTKSSGDVSAHTVNILASWMLEHPGTEVADEGIASTSRSEDTLGRERPSYLQVNFPVISCATKLHKNYN